MTDNDAFHCHGGLWILAITPTCVQISTPNMTDADVAVIELWHLPRMVSSHFVVRQNSPIDLYTSKKMIKATAIS